MVNGCIVHTEAPLMCILFGVSVCLCVCVCVVENMMKQDEYEEGHSHGLQRLVVM